MSSCSLNLALSNCSNTSIILCRVNVYHKLGEMSAFYYPSQVYFIYIARNHKFSKGFNTSYNSLHPSTLIQIRKKNLFDVEQRSLRIDPSSRTQTRNRCRMCRVEVTVTVSLHSQKQNENISEIDIDTQIREASARCKHWYLDHTTSFPP